MRSLILIIMWGLGALYSYAEEEEDIFADIDLGRMEVDANYQDDFDHIEKLNSKNLENSNLKAHPYDNFSQRSWVREEQSLGLFVGQDTIARSFYMTLFPQARFNMGLLQSYLGLPLRFPLYDNVALTSSGSRRRGFVDIEQFISPREADYRSFADAFKLIRRLDFGGLKKAYYVGLIRDQAISLGQGALMREFSADYLYDHDYLFARGHADLDFMRLEAMTGPIPKINILGVNANLMPLKTLGKTLENINFNIGYVADYGAPQEAYREENSFVLDAERRLIKRERGTAQGFSLGVGNSFEPIYWFNSRPYITADHLWLTGLKNPQRPVSYGLGFNVGHDALFNFSPHKSSQLFFRAEARFFSDNYMPNYFGGNYMLDRITIFESRDKPMTKAQLVSSTNENDWRFGHIFELGYAYERILNTKLSYENARVMSANTPIRPLRKLNFMTSLLLFDRLFLRASYEAQAIDNLKELFNFYDSRAMLALRSQVKIISFLYFDSWIKHSFGVNNMYEASASKSWLSHNLETRSLNYGIGVELAMTF